MTGNEIEGPPYKLTYLINTLDWGGAQTGMVRLLSGVDAEQFDTTIVCFRIDADDFLDELPESITVIELDINKKYQFHRLRPLLDILEDTDILVCSMYYSSIVGTVLGTLKGTPAIFRWQHMTEIKNRMRFPIHKLTSRLSTTVLADCLPSADTLRTDVGVSGDKITVLNLAGIDLESFPTPNVSNKPPVKVGAIGRLQPQKNFHTFIEVASRFEDHDYKFEIIGDGPMRKELENKTADLSSVELLGELPISDVKKFLCEWDIYFQPSKYEGLCITVLEAMASGLPVVASPVGGISQSVVDGETGFLVKNHNVDNFEQAITKLGEDADLRRRMGNAGRERVSDHYSKDRLAGEFTQIVEDALYM
jgi:glycosyltransferase involved in cell wall biosynthesis